MIDGFHRRLRRNTTCRRTSTRTNSTTASSSPPPTEPTCSTAKKAPNFDKADRPVHDDLRNRRRDAEVHRRHRERKRHALDRTAPALLANSASMRSSTAPAPTSKKPTASPCRTFRPRCRRRSKSYFTDLHDSIYVVGFLNILIAEQLQLGMFDGAFPGITVDEAVLKTAVEAIADVYFTQMSDQYDTNE
ncbi:MAG: hypothetical protein MZU97_24490 [Bacillus subtilis]|nr:hypothetical protein [Bacillus subtilis]